MKKIFVLGLALLLILPLISAINLKVEKQSSDEIMIHGLNKEVSFDLKITNFGQADNLKFYNLVGLKMSPSDRVVINSEETKEIQLNISPIGDLNHRGFYTFMYFIRGQDDSEIEEKLTFEIIELGEAFKIGSGEINLESNSLEIYIQNIKKFDFNEINVKFSSVFFEIEKKFSLGPNEIKKFNVQLDQDDLKKLMAGFYTLNAEINVDDEKADVEGIIKFVEKNLITTTTKDYGIIINTNIISKKNEGNILAKSETVIKKNILSRLFTNFNPEPVTIERDDFIIYYTWIKEIKPDEEFKIIIKTNWLFPLIIILFIITIIILTKQYSKTNLILRKKVCFVNAKGGEFALKISIFIHAKRYIEKVNIIDRLPLLVKIHERFNGKEPTRIDEKNKRIEWDFEKLEAGETRMISYIIYSKIGILGKFALPKTTAIYEKNGKIGESESNRAFFVSEQKLKKSEEEDE